MNLKTIIETEYNIKMEDMLFVRKMIGTTYLIKTTNENYIAKIYDYNERYLCEKSAKILSLLNHSEITPRIYSTLNNNYFYANSKISILLMDYLGNNQPKKMLPNQRNLLRIKQLHQQLNRLSQILPKHSYAFFIGRFLEFLRSIKIEEDIYQDFLDLGTYLFDLVSNLPVGPCHGDLHNENIRIMNGEFKVFDFDTVCMFSPLIDYVVMFERSHFNIFHPEDYQRDKITFTTCLDYLELDQARYLIPMLAFTAVRHYELIATIASVKGSKSISQDFIKEQHNWIKSWVTELKNEERN